MSIPPGFLTSLSATELYGSGRISLDNKGVRGVRMFKVPWANRYTLAWALAGKRTTVSGQTTFDPPDEWPDFEGLFVSNVDVEHFDGCKHGNYVSEIGIGYEWAKVTAQYSTLSSENGGSPTGDDDAAEAYDFTAQFISSGHANWFWGNNTGVPEAIDGAPARLISAVELSVHVSNYRQPPLQSLFGLVGKVNNAVFLGAAVGKMLYLGGRASRKRSGSTWVYEIDQKFVWRPEEHNKFFNPATGAWAYITDAADNRVYEAADLSPTLLP